MDSYKIKNVIFDVGNVIVRWSPNEIVRLTFGSSIDCENVAKSIFQTETWRNLNRGLLTEADAKKEYRQILDWTEDDCDRFFYYVKATQLLLFGTVDLVMRLKQAGYRVFALTDNVLEIVDHLKSTYSFWELFEGTTVSAEVGFLKPQPEIYQSLLSRNKLNASECVFLDDMDYNVKGAELVGIRGIQFENARQCEIDLQALGLRF